MKAIKVGMLGAGFMGGVHAKSLLRIPGVTLEAICSIPLDPATKLRAGLKLEAARLYDDFDRMLAQEKLDALYVCIPPCAHDGQVVKAAKKGLHVFLEKPIAFNSAQAAEMVEAIRRAGVKSQVGFHFRFKKSVQAFKAMIDAGGAGRPTLFAGRYWTNMLGSDWWRDASKSRGQVFEQLIHIYDLATYLCGQPQSVAGVMANLCHGATPGYTIEDTSLGTIRFAGGALASIAGSNCAVPMHFFGDFRVAMEKATLEYVCAGQSWVTPDRAVLYRGEKDKDEIVEDGDPYFAETEDFIRAIREDGATRTPAQDGLLAIRLVEKVMESAQKGGGALPF